ncbi:MAG TPA: CDP-archaeol synthase [Anaerolineaceae bacterium]|nr:CDP-archaeol synthase [Anaerolineaceae bacterium]
MMQTRIKTAIILLIIGLTAVFLSNWFYFVFIGSILLLAAKEYTQIYQNGGYQPSLILILGFVFVLVLFRYLFVFEHSDIILAGVFLLAMGLHTIQYERGVNTSPIDMTLTLGGILYYGWLGGYFISIMFIPDGQWWLLLTISIIIFSDSGAFFIGRRFGKRKLAPRTSPKKTWEGLYGGIVFGIIGGILMGLLFHQITPSIDLIKGLILGIVLSVITPLGDFGESMIKRQFNVKDSSNLLPGHGGAMDRIDTWVWAVCIGYYLVVWFF